MVSKWSESRQIRFRQSRFIEWILKFFFPVPTESSKFSVRRVTSTEILFYKQTRTTTTCLPIISHRYHHPVCTIILRVRVPVGYELAVRIVYEIILINAPRLQRRTEHNCYVTIIPLRVHRWYRTKSPPASSLGNITVLPVNISRIRCFPGV